MYITSNFACMNELSFFRNSTLITHWKPERHSSSSSDPDMGDVGDTIGVPVGVGLGVGVGAPPPLPRVRLRHCQLGAEEEPLPGKEIFKGPRSKWKLPLSSPRTRLFIGRWGKTLTFRISYSL